MSKIISSDLYQKAKTRGNKKAKSIDSSSISIDSQHLGGSRVKHAICPFPKPLQSSHSF